MKKDIPDDLLYHVGKRIKLFRTKQNLTITQLGDMVHLSPSAISKYENAKLSIDIRTLVQIAEALEVTVNQLIDYQKPVVAEKYKTNTINFFRRSNRFYMYQYFHLDKRIHACVIEITERLDYEPDKISLYYSCEDLDNYVDSGYIYTGKMSCYDLITNFSCKNPYNPSDELSIYAKSTFAKGNITTGLLCALSQSLRNPYAIKVIFSLNPLPQDDELKEQLSIFDKVTYNEIKRTNALVIY